MGLYRRGDMFLICIHKFIKNMFLRTELNLTKNRLFFVGFYSGKKGVMFAKTSFEEC